MKSICALLYATATAVLAAIALGFTTGKLTPGNAAAALSIGVIVGLFSLWFERKTEPEKWQIDPIGGAVLLIFTLFALRCFLWLVFEAGDNLWVFSVNNLGDFPLHLTYVKLLASGCSFWPENPIFAGQPLTYPVGVDLLNSLLVLVGVDIYQGFVWVGLIASVCAAGALWRWGKAFVVAGFLFAGGTLGFAFFSRLELVDYQSDLAHQGLTVGWKSLPLALYVTQRGLLYALPAGLMLLASWRARFLEPNRAVQRLPVWGEILLYAAMPVFHMHTFLVLSVFAAWWFIAIESSRRHLALVVGSSFLPATFLVWCVTGGFHGASMLGWQPGWMQGERGYQSAFSFWLVNFGALPVLTAWLVGRLVSQKGPRSDLAIVFPALAIFLTCCFIKFAPWEWDNTKLMIWSYLAILPVLWRQLLSRMHVAHAAAWCFLLFFSGAISLFGGMAGHLVQGALESREQEDQPTIGYAVGVRSEIAGVAFATRDIPSGDRFVAHPNYNHPLLECGRILLMGYEGHVSSHGIDYRERARIVDLIMKGEDGWREQARALGARWLFWGSQEEDAYPDSTRPWKTECALVAEGDWGAIYDLYLDQPVAPGDN